MTRPHPNPPRPPASDPPGGAAALDGILLVDKPAGWTSHDVVAKIRNHFRIKKVGHGGTLDPMATGLLIILLGRGTKLAELIMGSDKTYEGTLRLGIATDSHDAEGEVSAEHDSSAVTRERLEKEMAKWSGDVMQTPPMVSAIKKDGVPLYKLARKGQSVERKPRLLHIYSLDLLAFDPPEARFRLVCSKGTYVRTLCHDIGQGLGCGAHLCELRRTRSGIFDLAEARPLDQLLALSRQEMGELVQPVSRFRQEDLM